MKKRVIGLLIGIGSLIAVLGGVVLCAAVQHSRGDLFGVRRIGMEKDLSGEYALTIDCFGIYGYRIEPMAETDPVFRGEQEVPAEELGQYRFAVWLSDARATRALAEKYPLCRLHTLEDVPKELAGKVNVYLAYPPDDSLFVVYIGSDEPLDTAAQPFTKTGEFPVRLRIGLTQAE